MHYSFMPDIRQLLEGDVFVAKGASWGSREKALLTVVSARPHGPVEAVDGQGRTYSAPRGDQKLSGPDGTAWSPLWTLPMPALGEDEALRYVEIMTGLEGNDAPSMFHIREIGPEHAIARLVYTLAGDKDDDVFRDGPPFYTWTQSGTARVMDQDVVIPNGQLPEGCLPLDLVVSPGFRCDFKDGILQTTFHRARLSSNRNSILASGVDPERLQDFLPFRDRGKPTPGELTAFGHHGSAMRLADHLDFENEACNAETRTQPDEALVLWYPSDFRENETECSVISHTGYVFHITDAPGDQFYGSAIEPGLWVFDGAKFWSHTSYEGEHDWGIDGDWRPARPADAARFGFTDASLSLELADVLVDAGFEVETEGLAAKWMTMAEDAAANERAKVTAADTNPSVSEDLNP